MQSNSEYGMESWLENILGKQFTYIALQGDASSRRYYRITVQQQTYILMQAPVDSSWHAFLKIADHLSKAGLYIPKRLHINDKLGLIILEDLGDKTYLSALTEDTANWLYEDAIQAILIMQDINNNFTDSLPKMDIDFLNMQFKIFKNWFLVELLKNPLSVQQSQKLDIIIYNLIQKIVVEPKRLTHLDYHSRNLMLLGENNPGILDFQDALMGPYTYDLVSLLQDCYISWPRDRVEKWACRFKEQFNKKTNIPCSTKDFLASMDMVGLQRHLKNLGIFSRLYLRDNKPNYLASIPTILNNILEICRKYREYNELKILFEDVIIIKFEELKTKLPILNKEQFGLINDQK